MKYLYRLIYYASYPRLTDPFVLQGNAFLLTDQPTDQEEAQYCSGAFKGQKVYASER